MSRRREPVTRWSPGAARPAIQPVRPPAVTRDAGEVLPPGVRQSMERRLGEDFSGVRVHADGAAATAAAREQAQAFAMGDDIVFGAGRYAPGTTPGDALLEHELGHVREQRSTQAVAVQRQPEGQAVAPPTPAPPRGLHLDPDIGRLSLGLSTIDDFDFNQATLKPAHEAKIEDVAGKLLVLLERLPLGRITVTGHADLTGGENVNLAIGQRRAEAVEHALVAAGVPAASIGTASEGRRSPVVKKAGPQGRNRRVEVRFEGEIVLPGPGTTLSPGGATPMPPDVGKGVRRWVPPVITGGTLSQGPSIFGQVTPSPPARQPKAHEGPTRPASGGDAVKAILKVESVKAFLDDQARRFKRGTTTAEKVGIGLFTIPMAAIAGYGVASDPVAKRKALELLDGAEIDPQAIAAALGTDALDRLKGLSIKLDTKGSGGVTIQVNLLELGR